MWGQAETSRDRGVAIARVSFRPLVQLLGWATRQLVGFRTCGARCAAFSVDLALLDPCQDRRIVPNLESIRKMDRLRKVWLAVRGRGRSPVVECGAADAAQKRTNPIRVQKERCVRNCLSEGERGRLDARGANR